MFLTLVSITAQARLLTVCACVSFTSLQAQDLLPLEAVNTEADEMHPVIHPAGDLYFTRLSKNPAVGGNSGGGDVWKSSPLSPNDYAAPTKVTDFSTPHFDLLVGFPDSVTAYVYHHQQKGMQGIFVYQWQAGEWQLDSALNIPGFRSLGPEFNARLAPDGKSIFMSMQSFESYGNEDMYVSFWKEDQGIWSPPVNLGTNINSAYQELTPFLSNNSDILFFSSNRPGEGSGFQLFYSERQDDSFLNWTVPVPLTFLDQEGVTLSYLESPIDQSAYFTSTTSSEGYGDIFKLSQPLKGAIYDSINDNRVLIDTTVPLEASPERTTPLKGEVLDSTVVLDTTESRPENPAERKQRWLDQVAKELSDFSLLGIFEDGEIVPVDGISGGQEVASWVLTVPGFMPMTVDMDSSFSKDMLVPASPGMRLDLKAIQFERGSFELADSTSIGYIKAVAGFLIASPSIKIGLEGHTDNLGNVGLNKTLSTQRAAKIRDLLVESGVDLERIRVSGFGGTRPIADNATEMGRILNRRVELVVL